jgi:hypothetical protein
MTERHILRENVEGEPWGTAFLRELDLVVAANVVASDQARTTLYEDQLAARIAARCRPLDRAYREEFLGVVPVPQTAERWRRVEEALKPLLSRPRGAWAILEMDGGYDVYMANGLGGYGTPSGNKFTYQSRHAPALTADTGYASCLSYMAYRARHALQDRLDEERLDRIDIAPGTVFRDVYMNGKTWNRVTFLGEFLGERGRRVVHLERARRGVRTERVETGRSFKQALAPTRYEMPADLDDADNPSRVSTLGERRHESAQASYEGLAGRIAQRGELSPLGSKGAFLRDGPDRLVRPTYRGLGAHAVRTGTVEVSFESGTDAVSNVVWTPVEGEAIAA